MANTRLLENGDARLLESGDERLLELPSLEITLELDTTIDPITLVATITDGSTPSRVYPIFGSSIFV